MRSIRTKITVLNVIAISIALVTATVIAGISIATFGHEMSEEDLSLLCETGKNNLNYYLKSVEQSANAVSGLITRDLSGISNETEFMASFHEHMEYAEEIFNVSAQNANGAYTYYYRIDLSITEKTGEKGFWYVDEGPEKGFVKHEPTDLSDDQFECVWFYKPKATGEPLWLSPYYTDNLNECVISYNVPVYGYDAANNKYFIGVVGIEIDYRSLGKQIADIKAMDTGYAYIVLNDDGSIIYHPYIDLLSMPEEERPLTPPEFKTAFLNGQEHIEYKFEGVSKHCFVEELSNNMSIVVCVPMMEVTKIWINVVLQIGIAALIIIGAFVAATIIFSRRITKPLKNLTTAADEIYKGNYDVQLDYKGDDEIGVLTNTFNRLIDNLAGYIQDLNSLAYADSLTEVRNRSSYEIFMRELNKRIQDPDDQVHFAIAVFDCDDLKAINDVHGHDKGNVYLKNSCHLMCRVFSKSVVYRIGGDEFAIILLGEDYEHREKLREQFLEKSAEICALSKEDWEQIRVSVGIATYDPNIDSSAEDVMIHADHLMYANKRDRKKKVK